MAKTASLSSGLVVKKGEAQPVSAVTDVAKKTETSPKLVGTGQTSPLAKAQPKSEESASGVTATYYKSLTVKLDRERYEALKIAGAKVDKKSQVIFVEALDLWLKANSQR